MSYQTDIENKEKVQALSLAKECYSMKLDLLTNATVVDDAIRFVVGHSEKKDKDKLLKEITNDDIKKEVTTSTTTDISTANRVF